MAVAKHRFRVAVETRDMDALVASLAPDVVFYPPIRDAPLRGREAAVAGLRFAAKAFAFTDRFRYVDELAGASSVALVFETEIDGQFLEGVDYLVLDEDGLVRELRISMRPVSAAQKYLDFVTESIASGEFASAYEVRADAGQPS
ncbi:nuclear transport factor 2 family protein [Umezawaea endophytica]|uniref:Nuclear transport factor 2 family protein n=1 Tax=Umezawaea endophytica TaxID=1654476 RepID=A0A9X3AES2_9PSEU|nr:nuclear transport factor 2 family protein [Umezawaea endophytica]MCS7477677.1 nuclear transport factor 2 family protein [Umezawaea endophytica]